MSSTPTVLKKIIARKYEEVAERLPSVSIQKLEERIGDQTPCRGFVKAIEAKIANGKPAVIAEIKKASPSKGVIRADFRPITIAESYEQHGAACLSVLTDIDYFQGADHYLTAARNAVNIPVIRKDFIIDDYQVFEARSLGADCILLIVAALDKAALHRLNDLAHSLGMDVLVEVHDKTELNIALELPNRLIGINNRNLHNFAVTLDTTFNLLGLIDNQERIVVTESGILAPPDVEKMHAVGVNAFLVGEAFMRADVPGEALEALFA